MNCAFCLFLLQVFEISLLSMRFSYQLGLIRRNYDDFLQLVIYFMNNPDCKKRYILLPNKNKSLIKVIKSINQTRNLIIIAKSSREKNFLVFFAMLCFTCASICLDYCSSNSEENHALNLPLTKVNFQLTIVKSK